MLSTRTILTQTNVLLKYASVISSVMNFPVLNYRLHKAFISLDFLNNYECEVTLKVI